jgi:hypothetical protein
VIREVVVFLFSVTRHRRDCSSYMLNCYVHPMWSNMSVIPMNQDFQENRLLMSFVNFHEQEKISKEIVTHAIESCMKKQADNLLNSLDVINGRLSQLELYCYILERSIGELRSDVMDYHNEANLNFRCVEKQVKEVYHDALGTSTTVCCEVSSPLTLNALCLVSKFSVTRFMDRFRNLCRLFRKSRSLLKLRKN